MLTGWYRISIIRYASRYSSAITHMQEYKQCACTCITSLRLRLSFPCLSFSLHCHTKDPAVLFQINKIREFYLIACFLFFSFNPQEVIRSLVKRYVASMIRSAKTSEGLTEENFKVLLKLTALFLSHINIRKCMLINKNTDTSNHSSNAPVLTEHLEIFFHIWFLLSLFAIISTF